MSKSVYLPEPSSHASSSRKARPSKLTKLCLILALAVLVWLPWRRPRPEPAKQRGEIQWKECKDYAEVFECGTLVAPLDYTNLEDERNATIAIIRYKAGAGKTPRSNVLGSVLLNPGGPGGSGIHFIAHEKGIPDNLTASYHLDSLLGSKYDLVSFDPRGVGETWPKVQCFGDTHKYLYNQISESVNGLPGSHGKTMMPHEIGTLLAESQIYGEVCSNHEDAELFRFMNTPFVARDMHLLHKALGDSHINYWGFSYGSVLGSTYADIFPHSVRRLVIDGVVDVPNYYEGKWNDNFRDTEAELDHFFSECFESGSEVCPLSSLAKSTKELKDVVLRYGEHLKKHPVAVSSTNPPQILTYNGFILNIFAAMYVPVQWPLLANKLYEAIAHNKSEAMLLPIDLHPSRKEESEAFEAILCGDSLTPPAKTDGSSKWSNHDYLSHIDPIIKDSKHFAHIFGRIAPVCEGAWQKRGAEQHHGNFTSETSYPILAIGNEYDPVTPGQYADKMASLFPKAVSVRRDGYGHCSLSQPSRCIEQVLLDYFVEGKLPEEGMRCPVDLPVFRSTEVESTKHKMLADVLLGVHL